MAKVALLIGISEYEPGLNPLPAAVKDVEAMGRVLANPEMGGFASSDITLLKNPQRQEMEDAIYRLFSNRQKDDLLLFYFSGHGVKDESGKLYLSTRTTRKDNGRLVKPSAVAASFLHESINESRSQRQVIILDCCFSGAIAQGMTIKDDGTVNIQEQLGGKGRAILTSSTSTQYSFEQEGSELSIYTRYLVEGIEKGAADQDGDGWICVDELHEYASGKVRETAPAMTPKFYPVEEGYRIRLTKSPKDDPRLKYRKEVENRAIQGKFSVFALEILESRRIEWGLSEDEATVIREEALQPYRDYERKQHRYEQKLIDAVNEEYPFAEPTQKDLKDYQKLLGLRDEDIASIEKRVLSLKKAQQQQRKQEHQQNLRPNEAKPQLKNRWLIGIGGTALLIVTIVGIAYLRPFIPEPNPSPSPTQPVPSSVLTLAGHSDYVNSVAISPDGQTIASGSRDNTIKLWNLKTGKLIRTLIGHSGYVNSVAISPDGQTIASGSVDRTIKLWSLKTGDLIRTLTGHSSFILSIAISPDGQTLASGSNDYTIKLWNLKTGELIRTLTGHRDLVEFVTISPDGQIIASGGRDGTIRLWNLKTGEPIRTLAENFDWVTSIAIDPDRQTIIGSNLSGTIKLWNLKTGDSISLNGKSDRVYSIAISSDGKTFASGGSDNTIKLWNLQTGELIRTLKGHSYWVRSVAISPNGQTLVSGSWDKTVKIWQLP